MRYRTHSSDTSLLPIVAYRHGIDIHGPAWKANEEVRILPRHVGATHMHKFLSNMNCIEKTVTRCIMKIQGL